MMVVLQLQLLVLHICFIVADKTVLASARGRIPLSLLRTPTLKHDLTLVHVHLLVILALACNLVINKKTGFVSFFFRMTWGSRLVLKTIMTMMMTTKIIVTTRIITQFKVKLVIIIFSWAEPCFLAHCNS